MNITRKTGLGLVMAAAFLLCGIAAWADPPSQVGRLSLVSGSVSFRPGSMDEWAQATLNYPLTEGDSLWTDASSRAELQVLSAAIRLDAYTDFSFLRLDDETVQLRLGEGSLNVNLRNADYGGIFEIDTPNATVTLPQAGSYRVDVSRDGETSVTVREGLAEVTAGGDAYNVRSGQFTGISGSDSFSYFVKGAPRADEWDAWCEDRDRRNARGASSRYLPRGMIGSEDLDENGSWTVVDNYGPAWAPSRVPAGWAPYRYGRWTWVEPWGWTWIDDMPWGFAPFHYGRWAYVGSRWLWLPGAASARPVYAPALVVFLGGQGIGWFPLGPREVYIPPYQASPAYVQRINIAQVVNINIQVIQRYDVTNVVYVNRNAPRGATFVPREAFANSRPAGGSMLRLSQAQASRAPFMGMTAMVAPRRESVIAQSVAPRSPVPQPPASSRTRPVFSRIAPPPAQIPFELQQGALKARPGQPIDPDELLRLRRSQQIARPPVTLVDPATLSRQAAPPASAPRIAATPQAAVPRATAPVAAQAAPPAGQDRSGAASLIATLKSRSLPDAERQLAEARKARGIRLDLNGIARSLASARASLAEAEKSLARGDPGHALRVATAIQDQIAGLVNQMTAAMQAVRQPAQRKR